jgi:hypothetical protein
MLLAWNIANLCYPIWSWATFASLWIGLATHPFFFWIIERFRVRAFVVPKFKLIGPEPEGYYEHLAHLGFLYSVWSRSDNTLCLSYYYHRDGFHCPRKRGACCAFGMSCNVYLGWLVVILTDAIPIVVPIGLVIAGWFLGVSALLFFSLGLILAFQLQSLSFRFGEDRIYWDSEMFLDEKKCTTKPRGLMTCILEGPDGELFLSLSKAVEYEHFVRDYFITWAAKRKCKCCSSVPNNALPENVA